MKVENFYTTTFERPYEFISGSSLKVCVCCVAVTLATPPSVRMRGDVPEVIQERTKRVLFSE
jgi:hypothetical protein